MTMPMWKAFKLFNKKPRLRDYLLGDTCGGTVGDDVNG